MVIFSVKYLLIEWSLSWNDLQINTIKYTPIYTIKYTQKNAKLLYIPYLNKRIFFFERHHDNIYYLVILIK